LAFFNELSVTIYLYILMLMTDYLDDQSSMHRVSIGYALALHIFIVVGINFIFAVVKIIKEHIKPRLKKIVRLLSKKTRKYSIEPTNLPEAEVQGKTSI
jgi:ABC-type polysaccharide/polyol phosphate export permease